MSDPELDLECQRGARPKVAGPLTTQTIQEEAMAASTEEPALQLRGMDFLFTIGRTAQDFRKEVLEELLL